VRRLHLHSSIAIRCELTTRASSTATFILAMAGSHTFTHLKTTIADHPNNHHRLQLSSASFEARDDLLHHDCSRQIHRPKSPVSLSRATYTISHIILTSNSIFDNDSVIIRVGGPSHVVEILVNCDLICSVSPYFRSAFQGKFQEATDRVISLPDVTEETFRIFLQWARSQEHDSGVDVLVPTIPSLPSSTPPPTGHTSTSSETHAMADDTDMVNSRRVRSAPAQSKHQIFRRAK
jgi:hypothetical protein